MSKTEALGPGSEGTADEAKIYAGFWIRLAGYLIDYLVFDLLLVLLWLAGSTAWSHLRPIGQPGTLLDIAEVWLSVLYVPVLWLYRTTFESSKTQGTVGKIVFGLAVTDSNLHRIGFGRANARFWSRALSFFLFFAGFVMAAFTRRKQALHDMIAGTVVVKKARIHTANISPKVTP